jgi:endonuclease/exonuclease/phosphatase family metal-dependent hydrolase
MQKKTPKITLSIASALLATTALLSSTSAWAESYVYLTNNTNQTLDLTITQRGSPLTKGEHWQQHVTSVPPLGTVRYLETNRDVGIKWGKDYYFDTIVTAEDGSTAMLQQKLTGTWNFSDIWHGTQTSPWYNDRNIHSVKQNFSGKESTIAFKAEAARASGDDYYYVIHPKEDTVIRGTNNKFNVLAYNVWALLPGLVSRSVSERLNLLKDKLNGYDAIVFSELFDNSNRNTFLNAIKTEYPYQTQVVDRSGSLEDGGVLIVSRYPIDTESQIAFDDCDAEDCMSAKGVIYAKINKGGNPYHIFGSHTQAWSKPKNQATRLGQFEQMRDFIDSKNISTTEPVIIAGDLNVDNINFPQEYNTMLNVLNAEEAPRNGGYPYTYNGHVNSWTDGAPENLDYVLYSTAHLQPIHAESKVLTPRSIHADVFTKYDLSDHFAMAGNLTFDTPTGSPQSNLVYKELRNGDSNKCLDFEGSSPSNGSLAILWDCANVAWQKWALDQATGLLHNQANPEYCLDNMGQAYSGGGIHMWQCDANNINQQWQLIGNSLQPKSNSAIAVDAYGSDNGSKVAFWTKHNENNQKWSWDN